METVFRAMDGKIFEDKEACLYYERQLTNKNYKNQIIGLTYELDRVDYAKEDFVDRVRYLSISTEEALAVFIDRCIEEGECYTGLDKAGFYEWDGYTCYWVSLDAKIEEFKETIKNYKTELPILEEAQQKLKEYSN